jgi:hypothetical protein
MELEFLWIEAINLLMDLNHFSWCIAFHTSILFVCLQCNVSIIITYHWQNAPQKSSACQVYLSYRILTHPYQCSPRPHTDLHNIRFNFKPPFTPSSSKLSLSLTFPHQNLAYTCPHLYTFHNSYPHHATPFDHPKSEEDKSWSPSQHNIPQSPATSNLIGRDTFLCTLCLNPFRLRSSKNTDGQS